MVGGDRPIATLHYSSQQSHRTEEFTGSHWWKLRKSKSISEKCLTEAANEWAELRRNSNGTWQNYLCLSRAIGSSEKEQSFPTVVVVSRECGGMCSLKSDSQLREKIMVGRTYNRNTRSGDSENVHGAEVPPHFDFDCCLKVNHFLSRILLK